MLSVISVSRKHCFSTNWSDRVDQIFICVLLPRLAHLTWLLRCLNPNKQKSPMKPVTGFSGFVATDHCTSGWVVSAGFIMSHPL